METALKQVLTNNYKDQMIRWMDNHPEAFDEAIQLAVSDVPRYSWRAAWLLWGCMGKNDPRVRPHISTIINSLTTKNPNHQRELLKILLWMEINEEHEGVLFDICTTLWEKISNPPSVRHNALRMILRIATNHPGLSQEIKLILQDQYMDSLSPAAIKSIRKMTRWIYPSG
jgi:hypothetical protein